MQNEIQDNAKNHKSENQGDFLHSIWGNLESYNISFDDWIQQCKVNKSVLELFPPEKKPRPKADEVRNQIMNAA